MMVDLAFGLNYSFNIMKKQDEDKTDKGEISEIIKKLLKNKMEVSK